MLVLAMAAGRDDRLAPLFQDKFVKAVGVIGFVGDDLMGWKATDQVACWCHIVLLPWSEREADRQAERIDYHVQLAAEAPARAAESLGLQSHSTPPAGGLRIGAYHGGVDREPFQIAIGRDGFEDPIKDTPSIHRY